VGLVSAWPVLPAGLAASWRRRSCGWSSGHPSAAV